MVDRPAARLPGRVRGALWGGLALLACVAGVDVGRAQPPRGAAASLDDLFAPDREAPPPPRPTITPPPDFPEARWRNAGLRKVTGKHLTLYTDLPLSPAVDESPAVFDAAVPLWCEYFRLGPTEAAEWRIVGCLMRDRQPFVAAGMLPADLPDFPNGYYRDSQLWLYDQPSDYYRRALLLHEGTHAFMHWRFGAAGPPWYMEGVAELLGTHRWQEGRLALNVFPASRDEAPYWGRIKLIEDAFAERRALGLDQVLAMARDAHLQNEAYGWSWGAAALLDGHPDFRDAFRGLRDSLALDRDTFNTRFRERLGARWPRAQEAWQLFVVDLTYGYDVARNAVTYKPGVAPPAEGAAATIAADRGWQSSGVLLEAGRTYRVAASGRFQVAAEPTPWMSEADGVTIRYWKGRPLGQLLGAIRPETPAGGLTPLVRPAALGAASQFTAPTSGVLYLKINDSPAELADNAGQLTVRVTPVAPN